MRHERIVLRQLDGTSTPIDTDIVTTRLNISHRVIINSMTLLQTNNTTVRTAPQKCRFRPTPNNCANVLTYIRHATRRVHARLCTIISRNNAIISITIRGPLCNRLHNGLGLSDQCSISGFVRRTTSAPRYLLDQVANKIRLRALHYPSRGAFRHVRTTLRGTNILCGGRWRGPRVLSVGGVQGKLNVQRGARENKLFLSVHVRGASHTVRGTFLRLHDGVPLRGVGVGSLYTLTYIGGSAFCTRCRSVCTLSDQLRSGLVTSVLTDISTIRLRPIQARTLAHRLFQTFIRGGATIGVLFTSSHRNVFTGHVRENLQRHLATRSPAFTGSPGHNVLLSFYIRNYFCTFAGGDDQVSRERLIGLLTRVTETTRGIVVWGIEQLR